MTHKTRAAIFWELPLGHASVRQTELSYEITKRKKLWREELYRHKELSGSSVPIRSIRITLRRRCQITVSRRCQITLRRRKLPASISATLAGFTLAEHGHPIPAHSADHCVDRSDRTSLVQPHVRRRVRAGVPPGAPAYRKWSLHDHSRAARHPALVSGGGHAHRRACGLCPRLWSRGVCRASARGICDLARRAGLSWRNSRNGNGDHALLPTQPVSESRWN